MARILRWMRTGQKSVDATPAAGGILPPPAYTILLHPVARFALLRGRSRRLSLGEENGPRPVMLQWFCGSCLRIVGWNGEAGMKKPVQSKTRRRIGGNAQKAQASAKTRAKPGAKKPATSSLHNANLYLGGRLRHARLVQGLSLREVAAMVEVSEGYVSKLENDKVRPSLATLHRLANALQTNIGALVSESGPFDRTVTVIRLAERPVLQFAGKRRGEGVSLEKLIPSLPESLLQANVHVVEPGGASEDLIRHNGQEFGLVLEGELQLIVADETYEIRVGDAFSFDSDRPHGYRNLGKVTTRILWINTPPTF